ncbi:MAG: hypothetical protein RSA90_02675 [Lachnospiraceae bacterium]
MSKWIVKIVCLIIFIVCMGLIITGQRTIGLSHLVQMLIGLAGLLALLFAYNKKHQ